MPHFIPQDMAAEPYDADIMLLRVMPWITQLYRWSISGCSNLTHNMKDNTKKKHLI